MHTLPPQRSTTRRPQRVEILKRQLPSKNVLSELTKALTLENFMLLFAYTFHITHPIYISYCIFQRQQGQRRDLTPVYIVIDIYVHVYVYVYVYSRASSENIDRDTWAPLISSQR